MNNGPEHTKFERDEPAVDPALEAALRQVLRRTDTPEGFADRVMARALAGEKPAPRSKESDGGAKLLHWPQSRLWVSGAVAAALIAGLLEGGVALRHVREQQQKVVEATRQFQTTERITVRALAQAREQLQRAGVPLNLD